MIKELSTEKSKWEKKYNKVVADVNNLIDSIVKRGMKENYAKIMQEDEKEKSLEKELGKVKDECTMLKN